MAYLLRLPIPEILQGELVFLLEQGPNLIDVIL